MKPDELKIIEEEIAALRRRSDELAARVAEPRECAGPTESKPTENGGQPATPIDDEKRPV
jgi:hypothetical protein